MTRGWEFKCRLVLCSSNCFRSRSTWAKMLLLLMKLTAFYRLFVASSFVWRPTTATVHKYFSALVCWQIAARGPPRTRPKLSVKVRSSRSRQKEESEIGTRYSKWQLASSCERRSSTIAVKATSISISITTSLNSCCTDEGAQETILTGSV